MIHHGIACDQSEAFTGWYEPTRARIYGLNAGQRSARMEEVSSARVFLSCTSIHLIFLCLVEFFSHPFVPRGESDGGLVINRQLLYRVAVLSGLAPDYQCVLGDIEKTRYPHHS